MDPLPISRRNEGYTQRAPRTRLAGSGISAQDSMWATSPQARRTAVGGVLPDSYAGPKFPGHRWLAIGFADPEAPVGEARLAGWAAACRIVRRREPAPPRISGRSGRAAAGTGPASWRHTGRKLCPSGAVSARVGTAHTFQGGECDRLHFSTVADGSAGPSQLEVAASRNRVNVAATRLPAAGGGRQPGRLPPRRDDPSAARAARAAVATGWL